MQQPICYTDIISNNMQLPSENKHNSTPAGWVKLTKNANRNKKVGLKIARIPQTHTQNSIALLEHNIDLSFEFEKNRYYHPFQQPYDNYTESETEEEEMNE